MSLIKIGSNELIACLSIFLFVIPRFFFIDYPSLSFSILLFGLSILYTYFFIYNFLNVKKIIYGKIFLFIILCTLLIFIDSAFRANRLSYKYLYEFVIYVLSPFLFFINIRSLRIFLIWFCIISIFNYLLYAMDPFNGYKYTGDYMFYGFNVALPAFLGSFIGVFYFKKRILLVFLILSAISIIVFSNRSCTLSMIIFIILYALIFFKNKKKYFLICIIPFFLIFIYLQSNFLKIITDINLYFLRTLKFKSYTLEKFISYL